MWLCDWIKNWRIKPKKKVNKNLWGIIIPHTQKAQGAQSPSGVTEYDYALSMVEDMPDFYYETRDLGGVPVAAVRLYKKGCRFSLEPHKNAYDYPKHKANGFELLVLEDDKPSIKEALRITLEFKKAFPDRVIRQGGLGIKYIKRGDRGFGSLKAARDNGMEISILSEVFFLDNPEEYIFPKTMAAFWNRVLK